MQRWSAGVAPVPTLEQRAALKFQRWTERARRVELSRRYRAHLRPADFAKVFTAEGSFGDARKSEDAKVAELRASIASLGDDDDAAAKGDVVEKHGAGIDLLGYDADAGKHVAPALPSHYV